MESGSSSKRDQTELTISLSVETIEASRRNVNTFMDKSAYAALLLGTKRDIPSKFVTSYNAKRRPAYPKGCKAQHGPVGKIDDHRQHYKASALKGKENTPRPNT
ncbi:hypothetical protein AVEN_68358-1 [Araneus ventricosus]|uniref:Uncharacterized protein n=1 Tax=Araneus ventricosus TaxID=182803 RepID=A0A4Y2G2M2_ARAVE|nr:hypothetical protein AVEN_68358-1 [Araneus ventricosus]